MGIRSSEIILGTNLSLSPLAHSLPCSHWHVRIIKCFPFVLLSQTPVDWHKPNILFIVLAFFYSSDSPWSHWSINMVALSCTSPLKFKWIKLKKWVFTSLSILATCYVLELCFSDCYTEHTCPSPPMSWGSVAAQFSQFHTWLSEPTLCPSPFPL